MKKLINLTALVAVIAVAGLMAGCGSSDDNDETGFAPATVANTTMTLTEAGQSRDITFAATGNTFSVFEPGATAPISTGTFQYSRISVHSGQLVLTTSDAQGVTRHVSYQVNWITPQSGNYTFATSDGLTGSGTFANFRAVTAPVDPGPVDPGPVDPGPIDPGPVDPGTIPTTLSGRAVDFTAVGFGNERLTFGPGNAVTTDVVNPPNNVGTYTYTANPAANTATLNVTFPTGEFYNLNLNFTAPNTGTWSGVQHFNNQDHPVPAGSSFTIQN
jgi:hypothetical protein